jgi:uncharacterized membrane protein
MDEQRTAPIKKVKKSAVAPLVSAAVVPRKVAKNKKPPARKVSAKRNQNIIPTVVNNDAPSSMVSKVVTNRAPLALTLLNSYRFPVNIEQLMIGVARVGGVAFVVFGALGTLMYMSLFLNNNDIITQSAQLLSSNTQVATSSSQTTNVLTSTIQNSITVNQTPPLRGIVTITVVAPHARVVDLYLFEQSWQNKSFLGRAKQVSVDTWEYRWDTTSAQSGLDYRITAHVFEQSTTNTPDYTLQLGYMRVAR